MRLRLASGLSTIVLIVAALLASRAGVAGSFAVEAPAALVERNVDRAHGQPLERVGSTRKAFLHAQASSIGRVHAPNAGGSDGARRAVAHGAKCASLELIAFRAPGAPVDERRDVASPGQPAPSSRAPPIG